MFEIKAFAVNRNNSPVTRFSNDLALSFQLSRDFQQEELAGLDLRSLAMATFNKATGKWESLETTLSWEAGRPKITTTANHFSIFGSQANPLFSGPGQVLGFTTDLQRAASVAAIPIEVPRGPNGFAPSINLAYNSGSVDEMKNKRDVGSWVGIGWSLDLGYAGYNPETQKYTLNGGGAGGPLVYTGGASYKTDPDIFTRIDKVSVNGYGAFRVYDKGGSYFLYGGAADAGRYYLDGQRDEETGYCNGSETWYRYDLKAIRDLHGNEASIDYDQNYRYQQEGNGLCYKTIVAAYPRDVFWGKNVKSPGLPQPPHELLLRRLQQRHAGVPGGGHRHHRR